MGASETNIYPRDPVADTLVKTTGDQTIAGNKTFTSIVALGTALTTQNSFSMTAPGGAKIFTGAGGGTWQVSSGSTSGVSFIAQGLDNQTAPLMEFRKSVAGVVSAVGTIDVDGNTTLKKTLVIPHTWAISGEVKVPSGDTDYVLPFYVTAPTGQTVRLVGLRYRINSGTSVSFKIQRGTYDGAPADIVTGLSAISTGSQQDNNAVTLANEDRLFLVVTAVSGTPKNLTVTAKLEYTF